MAETDNTKKETKSKSDTTDTSSQDDSGFFEEFGIPVNEESQRLIMAGYPGTSADWLVGQFGDANQANEFLSSLDPDSSAIFMNPYATDRQFYRTMNEAMALQMETPNGL